MPLLLCDMDGVIADYLRAALALWNTTPEEIFAKNQTLQWEVYHNLGLEKDDVHNILENVGADFWENIQPYPWARVFWNRLHTLGDVVIASAPMKRGISTSMCVAGKVNWLKKWTDNDSFDAYHLTQRKSDLAQPGRALIDDKDDNVDDFRAAGGIGILFPQPWNRRAAVAGNGWKLVLEEIESLIQSGAIA